MAIFKALISEEHVREVINTTLDDKEIKGLIAAAATLVKSKIVEYVVDADVQIEMTRWVAAHFVYVKSSMISSSSSSTSQSYVTSVTKEKVGDAAIEYGSKSTTSTSASMRNLRSSLWGQVAIMFDPTGELDNLGSKPSRVVALTDV